MFYKPKTYDLDELMDQHEDYINNFKDIFKLYASGKHPTLYMNIIFAADTLSGQADIPVRLAFDILYTALKAKDENNVYSKNEFENIVNAIVTETETSETEALKTAFGANEEQIKAFRDAQRSALGISSQQQLAAFLKSRLQAILRNAGDMANHSDNNPVNRRRGYHKPYKLMLNGQPRESHFRQK